MFHVKKKGTQSVIESLSYLGNKYYSLALKVSLANSS